MQLHSPGAWIRVIARNAKRLMVFIAGVAVLLAGLAMLALPGPGVLVIILGLVILATEFAWAERVLDRTTSTAAGAANKLTDNRTGRAALALSGIGMIVGGILMAVFVDNLLVVGTSVAVAGVIGLITLLPQVRAWIDATANARTMAADADESGDAATATPS